MEVGTAGLTNVEATMKSFPLLGETNFAKDRGSRKLFAGEK